MPATDSNTLLALAACYRCTIPKGMEGPVLIAILGRLANMTDPNVLMQAAACYRCTIPLGMQMSVLLYQADQILTNGGTGIGGTQSFTANYSGGTPTAVPTSTLAIAVDTSNNEVWIWFSGAWHDTGMATA